MASKADLARRDSSKLKFREKSFLVRGKPLFMASVLIAALSIFSSEPFGSPWLLGVFVPIILMLAYLFIGLNGFVDAIDTETFADSVYYMGFLLTLVSLSAALYYLRNTEISLNLLVTKFGLALITTILGLAVRVTLVNFQIRGAQAQSYAQEKLATSVERFTNDLELTCDKMEILLGGTVQKVEMTAESVRSASDEAAASILKSAEVNSAKIAEMYEEAGVTWRESVTRVSSAMETQLIAAASSAAEQIRGLGTKLEEEFSSFELDKDILSKTLEQPLKDLAHTIRAARIMLAKEYELLRDASESHSGIHSQFEKLGGALDAGSAVVVQLNDRAQGLSEAFKALRSLDSDFVQLAGRTTEATEAMSGLQHTLSSGSASFSNAVESSKESYQRLNQSLNSLLHSVAKQAEEMSALVLRISEDAEQGRASLKVVQDNLIESSEVIVKSLGS